MPFPSIRSSSRFSHCRGLLPLLAVLWASGALVSPVAVAAPESADVKQAREHYKKGEAAFAGGRFDEAYREFDAGYSLSQRPLFLVNMAHVERRRGDLRKALAMYRKYLLIEPESKLRVDVESVIKEIEVALAAEDAAAQPAPGPVATAAPPGAATTAPTTMAGATAPPPILDQRPPGASGGTIMMGSSTPPPGRDNHRDPIYKKWWFLTGIGAVVTAVALTTIIAIGSGDSYRTRGSLGTFGAKP